MINHTQEFKTDSFANIKDGDAKKALLIVGKRLKSSLLNEPIGTPIYYWNETEVENSPPTLIEDFVLIDVNDFERRRIANMYRGGGSLIIQLKDCAVALYNDKRQWFGPIDGIAKTSEAKNLNETAIRSVVDGKIFVCDKEEYNRLVPNIPDIGNMSIDGTMDSWGFKVKKGIKPEGSIISKYALNPKTRTLESVVIWRIDRTASDIKFFHQRDPFSGNLSGEVLVGLSHHCKGKKIGYWSGQRGFVKTPTKLALNPILSRHFNSIIN